MWNENWRKQEKACTSLDAFQRFKTKKLINNCRTYWRQYVLQPYCPTLVYINPICTFVFWKANTSYKSLNRQSVFKKHSHILCCCLCRPLCVSSSPGHSLKSCGASRSLPAGCLMATPSYSATNTPTTTAWDRSSHRVTLACSVRFKSVSTGTLCVQYRFTASTNIQLRIFLENKCG